MMSKDLKGLLVAILLSTLVLIAWQYFYESPRREKTLYAQEQAQQAKREKQEVVLQKAKQTIGDAVPSAGDKAGTITINTPQLAGNIALQGLRFDDLKLKSYHETLNDNSPLVQLFTAQNSLAYFAEFGWIKDGNDQNVVPDKNSIWQCDQSELTVNKPINCHWKNNLEVYYFINIAIDNHYLFTITQSIENKSNDPIKLTHYGRIYKAHAEPKQFAILHEGAIGVFGDILKEVTYEDLSKSKQEIFTNSPGSWAGFTDKYWLSALIPDKTLGSKTNFLATPALGSETAQEVYNVNFVTDDVQIAAGARSQAIHYLFAGAKEEKLLVAYAKEQGFTLFDRAIDFGIFYFITKPLFWLISYFYSLMGNFGLAIILVTLTIKLLMYPLASKSFKSMSRMKELHPKIEQLKQRCGDDRQKLNQAMMELYKKENINPASGCLPLLVQIPVFFSLYKVIFISIEMRHAPFYGWIKDLSVPDPTSIWNLFGIMPWQKLGFLDIGLWPVIMGITMFVQQKLGPEPTDPVQANVMKFMPLILMVMLYSLPSGLMIYWSFSNILSIVQQYMISKGSKTA